MKDSSASEASDFDRFRDLARRLLAVPKSAVPKQVPTPRAKPVKGKKPGAN